MIRRARAARAAAGAALILAAACVGTHSSLADMAPVASLIVRSTHGTHAEYEITDRVTIDSVLAFVRTSRGWNRIWDTPPAGEWSVTFMRDSSMVAVLRLGSGFVTLRGYRPEGRDEELQLTPRDEMSLRAWLEIPKS